MIYGIGTDIAEVKRFKKWINNPDMINRFFNEQEKSSGKSEDALCQHYAARFAAKEAFSKALGTGLVFDLKDVFVTKNEDGKPFLSVQNLVKKMLEEKCCNPVVHLSISHEKEYATAFVVIEDKN